jgi:hypothetical protein
MRTSGMGGVRAWAHELQSAVTGGAPSGGRVWRRERRGPKGASNRESTPEADTQTIARHGDYKEAEPRGAAPGNP